MGMFDYVRSLITLPDGFDGELQSKDFDCKLSVIEIREDGTLWIEDFDREVVPAEERPHPDPNDPLHWVGMLRSVNRRWRKIEHHGHFNFYGSSPDAWHEYDAKFTDGRLVEIKLIEDDQ